MERVFSDGTDVRPDCCVRHATTFSQQRHEFRAEGKRQALDLNSR